jgi:hypothetical protein
LKNQSKVFDLMVNLKDTELKQVQAQLEDLEETNLELTLEV